MSRTLETPHARIPGGAPAPTNKPAPRDRKPSDKVDHLYWVADGNAAREMGVQVRGLCGIWFEVDDPPASVVRTWLVPGTGLATAVQTRDCKTCVRAYRAQLRRRYGYLYA